MEEQDKKEWEDFKKNAYPFDKIKTNEQLKKYIALINRLHAKYYRHKLDNPCSCNGGLYRERVARLDKIYERN